MSDATYKAAGVDRDAATLAKERIRSLARSTFTPGVVGDIGFFGGFFRLEGFRRPILVAHTDGVGTKLKIAALLGRYQGVGQDVVNHCVNDIFTCGARPLFFLDYMAFGRLRPERVEAITQGMVDACRAAGCALIGGETAEMPGVYQGDDFDLVGFIVGAVEEEALLTGQTIRRGDVLLGIPSHGLHTNGYSLVRRLFRIDQDPSVLGRWFPDLGTTLGEALLVPHRPYYPLLVPLLPYAKGMAHITGGGLIENVPRILPPGLGARFHRRAWEVPPLFRLIQQQGPVEEGEMFRVFNMGIGMVVAVAPEAVDAARRAVPEAIPVGEVVEGEGVTVAP
ncbi:MAG: phosphoribosylformylglycinamidine cyclo-ligase [Dehalococcoidia bacterium]|nr:phosphoribosylformylglycinamidine cyclo-ligase [Dehalococcoidia bacterium]MDW8120547.1 phosphoribosylformylglycinamidine cyclo-ligase [Chloroflexota bacterium]